MKGQRERVGRVGVCDPRSEESGEKSYGIVGGDSLVFLLKR